MAERARFELANGVSPLRHFQCGLPKPPHFGTCMRLNFNSTRTRLPLLLNSSLTEPCFWKCRSLRSGNAATSVVALRLVISAFIWKIARLDERSQHAGAYRLDMQRLVPP